MDDKCTVDLREVWIWNAVGIVSKKTVDHVWSLYQVEEWIMSVVWIMDDVWFFSEVQYRQSTVWYGMQTIQKWGFDKEKRRNSAKKEKLKRTKISDLSKIWKKRL